MARIARLKWWLVGAAVGMLIALRAAPTTGWIVRRHLRAGSNPFSVPSTLAELGVRHVPFYGDVAQSARSRQSAYAALARRAAGAMPDDYAVQMANALIQGRPRNAEGEFPSAQPAAPNMTRQQAALRPLLTRFGSHPALYADLLRYASMRPVIAGRPESYLLTGQRPPDDLTQRPGPSAERLEDFVRLASTGERLDAGNAFFPYMQATGLFGLRKDGQAVAALIRAGNCARWNDYAANEPIGRWRVAEVADGEPGALPRLAAAAALLFPHLAGMREAARVATYKAILAEQAGRTDEGLAIRRALTRVGALMRVQSTSVIGSLVGMACRTTAMARPGGAPPSQGSKRAGDEASRWRCETYIAYLHHVGAHDEAEWVRREDALSVAVRNIVRTGVAQEAWARSVIRTGRLGTASAAMLTSTAWLLLLAMVSALASRAARIREGLPMTSAGRWGAGLGTALTAVAVAVSVDASWAGRAAAWGVALLALLVMLRAKLKLAAAGGFLAGMLGGGMLASAVVLAVLLVRPWLVTGLALSQSVAELTATGDDERSRTLWLAAAPSLLPLALVPIASVGMALVSIAKRVPVSVGLVRGFARLGVPIACLAMLPYAGLVAWQGRVEAQEIARVRSYVAHEGRALAREQGVAWPGPP